MSNNNQFWGQRFGGYSPFVPKGLKEPRGNIFQVKSYGSQRSNTGVSTKNKESPQAKRDKEEYAARVAKHGRPVIRVSSSGKRALVDPAAL